MSDAPSLATVSWSRMHFKLMAEGGVWAIPRSGVVFTKRDGRLIWTAAMSWLPEMEGRFTREELTALQAAEFAVVREHFAAAGIEVVRAETISDEVFG